MRKFLTVILSLVLLASTFACSASKVPPGALYFDNFSANTSGWTVLQNEDGSIRYADNHYRITVEKADTELIAEAGQTFQDDVRIEVDARKVGGPDVNYLGVICRYQDPDNYYLFLITTDGYSGIVMRQNGGLRMISPGVEFLKMEGIKLGEKTNHLRVNCVGETLALYANGTQVSLAFDHTVVGGDVGLMARSSRFEGGTDIEFDNFAVDDPAQAPNP